MQEGSYKSFDKTYAIFLKGLSTSLQGGGVGWALSVGRREVKSLRKSKQVETRKQEVARGVNFAYQFTVIGQVLHSG